MENKELEKIALKKLENIDLNLQQKQTLLDVMSMVSKDVSVDVANWSIKNDYYKKLNDDWGIEYDKCLEIKNLTNEYNKVTFNINDDGYLYKSKVAYDLYNDEKLESVDYIDGLVNNIYQYILNPYETIYVNGKGNILFEKAVKLKGTIGDYNSSPTNFRFYNGKIVIDNKTGAFIDYISCGINNIVDASELNVIVQFGSFMFADNIFLKESPNIYITKIGNPVAVYENTVYFDYMFYNCKSLEKVYICDDNRAVANDGFQYNKYSLNKMLYGTKGGTIYNFTKTVTKNNIKDNSSKPNDYSYLTINESDDISDVKWNIHNEFYLTEIRNKTYDGIIWSINYNANVIYTPYVNMILATTDIPNDRASWKLAMIAESGTPMKLIINAFPNDRVVYYKHVYVRDCVTIDDFKKKYADVLKGATDESNITLNIKDIDYIPYYNSNRNEHFQLVQNNSSINNVSVRLIGDLATFDGHETGYVCTNYLNENNNSPISIMGNTIGINAEVNIDEADILYNGCSFAKSSIHGVKDGLTIKGKDLRKSTLKFIGSIGDINYDIDKITGGMFVGTYKEEGSYSIGSFPDFTTITKVDNYDSFRYTFQNNTKITSIDLSNITDIGEFPFICSFAGMFNRASNLQEVIVPNIKEWNTSAFNGWLEGAGSAVTGDKIIRKPVGLDIPSGDSGIPDGWIVKEYYKLASL